MQLCHWQPHGTNSSCLKFSRLQPGYTDAMLNLAALLSEQNRMPEADALYRDVLAHAPHNANGYNNYGVFLVKRGNVPFTVPMVPECKFTMNQLKAIWSRVGNDWCLFYRCLSLHSLTAVLPALFLSITLAPCLYFFFSTTLSRHFLKNPLWTCQLPSPYSMLKYACLKCHLKCLVSGNIKLLK